MGLFKALTGAVGGTLADQWVDFYTMDSLPANVLVAKGKRYTGGRGSNTKGSENVITNGSGFVVAPGQAVAIVDNGIITEFAAEPGQYTYDQSSEPTVFGGGDLGANLEAVFRAGIDRFKHGGGVTKDQRVYYFNTKEVPGNRYGTPNPVPFRVVDLNIGLDVDISIRCNGTYGFRLTNPILFFQSFAGNVGTEFEVASIEPQMRSELLTALQPAFAKISALGIRYSALPAHTTELAAALNETLSTTWKDHLGIEITSFGVNSVTASPEDEQLIKDLQKSAVLRDPNMAAATLAAAQADAMRTAAGNEAGALTGFMGMGFAQQAGGANPAQLFQQGAAQQQQTPQSAYPVSQDGGFPAANQGAWAPQTASAPGVANPAPVVPEPQAPAQTPAVQASAPTEFGWACSNCGHTGNLGKFCPNCGNPNPAV